MSEARKGSCDRDRAWGVDRLFRYEEIGTFVHFLEDRLGCEIILPRLNVSPPGATDLTPETDALLRDFAAEDFTLYQTLCPLGAGLPVRVSGHDRRAESRYLRWQGALRPQEA